MHAERRIAIPDADAVLVYREPLDKTGPADVDLWDVLQNDRSRPVRISIDEQASWVLTPHPGTDDERRRAAAQLATREIRAALQHGDFFDHHEEFDVAITTFDDRLNQQGQFPWDPAATPLE